MVSEAAALQEDSLTNWNVVEQRSDMCCDLVPASTSPVQQENDMRGLHSTALAGYRPWCHVVNLDHAEAVVGVVAMQGCQTGTVDSVARR